MNTTTYVTCQEAKCHLTIPQRSFEREVTFCVRGVVSPLLANIYLHAFDTAWRAGGLERRWQARLIRYADGFVVLCRAQAAQVQAVVADQLQALGLTLNTAKTRLLDARQQAFTFLGFTVWLVRSRRTGRRFPLIRPSAEARQRLRDQVKALTGRNRLALPTPTVIAEVNRAVRGWAGYFHFQHCTRDFSALRWFVEERVRTYLPSGASTGTGREATRRFRTMCSTGASASIGCRCGRPGPLRRMPCGEGDRRAGCGRTARPVR